MNNIKIAIAAISLSISFLAFAGPSTLQAANVADSGIITPNIAADGYRTWMVARTAAGHTVICPTFGPLAAEFRPRYNTCLDDTGKSAWAYPQQIIPPGKTYVGFRISPSGGTTYYEFYWK